MLRDSHSYETQIIDAVRSVNKALGGTYGTSSAIYKSEFNQYEVQLIDAIKGIGRTLSGNGLSVSSVGGGASSAELQSLSARVSKLENESFFRLLDGNVTLKEQYQNLWVPGWLAAGGIGTGGGGGGGSSYLKELLDIYHNDSGILRGDGTAVSNGDVLVYDDTTDPLNPKWVAAANSPAGAVTNYGDTSTGRIAKVGTVDIYNGVKWGVEDTTLHKVPVTINGDTKIVCLDGYAGGGGGGGAYALGTLTTATATKGTMLGVNAISNDLSSTGSESSLIVWEPNAGGAGIGAWHFLGNIYSDGWISAVGTGSPGGGGGGGTDLATVWNSLTNTVSDIYADTKINIAHIPSITTSMVSDLETWVATKGYLRVGGAFTLRTPISNTAANGPLLGVDAISNAAGSTPGSDTSRIEWDGNNYAWHVYGNLYADGWVAAGGPGSGGGGTIEHLGSIGDVTLSSPSNGQALVYRNGYWVNETISYTLPTASSSTLGGIKVGSGLSIDANGVLSATGGGSVSYQDMTDITAEVVLGKITSGSSSWTVYAYPVIKTLGGLDNVSITAASAGQALVYRSGYWVNETIQGGGGTVTSVGLSMPSFFSVSGSPVTSSGTLTVTLDIQESSKVLIAPATLGGGVPTFRKLVAMDMPDLSSKYVTLSTTQTITGAKAFSTNPVTIASSSGLSVHESSYIDIGPLRIEYDSTAKALHITKASSSDSNNYGIYADGFVAAGGSA